MVLVGFMEFGVGFEDVGRPAHALEISNVLTKNTAANFLIIESPIFARLYFLTPCECGQDLVSLAADCSRTL
jgi:hypothetical protein